MYSVRVCTTDDRELPAPELGIGLGWDRLVEILRREISPEAAELLAEPIHDAVQGKTHWHISASEDPRPFSALNETERKQLLAVLAERRGAVLKLADRIATDPTETNLRIASALRAILDVPDPEQHVWSAAGRPVLTAWGRSTAESRERRATIVTRGQAPATGAVALSGTVVGVGTVTAVEPPPLPIRPRSSFGSWRRSRSRGYGWWRSSLPLWLLFAVMLLAILYRLLPACSVNLPLLDRIFSRCELRAEARRPSELDLLRERNQGLRDSIRVAEIRVAAREGECAAPVIDTRLGPRGETTSGPGSGENASGPAPGENASGPDTGENTSGPSAKETEERSERAQGKEGKLDVTLAWNGREDLDLHVFCSGGEIWANNRNACGGVLDVDRNSIRDQREDHPVEHVTWVTDPPPGEYRVSVALYDRYELPARNVPFTVVVRDGNDHKVFNGVAKNLKVLEPVTQFRR
jgi:hypothetical protein